MGAAHLGGAIVGVGASIMSAARPRWRFATPDAQQIPEA